MELFLNLLWLSMALAALAMWRMQWARQRQEGRLAPWRQWTAFACAAVLLFFAVSLTDDLHADLILFDEASSCRRHSLRIDGHRDASHHAAHSGGSGPAVIAVSLFPVFVPVNRAFGPSTELTDSTDGTDSQSGRAPPVSFL
jgi:hypothetical protein